MEARRKAIARGDKPIEINCFGVPKEKYQIRSDQTTTYSNCYPARPEDFREYKVVMIFNDKLQTWQACPMVEYLDACPVCLKLMLVRAVAGTTWIAACSEECSKKAIEAHRSFTKKYAPPMLTGD